jgi:hypothetical protein
MAAHRVAQEVRLQARTGYRYTLEMLKALRDGGDHNAVSRAIDVCDPHRRYQGCRAGSSYQRVPGDAACAAAGRRVGVDHAIAQVQAAVQLADDPQRWLDAVWPKGP